jgi:hypothetical protein
MALWGNKDSKTASGTVSIADTGVVTGSGTSFTTQAKVGNYIKAGGVDYQIVSITSNTVAKVIMGKNNGNGTVTTASGASYTLSEKPASVAHESADNGYGSTGDANKVFGVDSTEVHAGGDDVAEVAIVDGGSGYLEVPTVTFASGSQTATATIAGGKVTAITITGSGSYASAPVVSIDVPRRTVATSGVSTSTDTITYTAHGLSTGDAVKYYANGGTAIAGLTNATVYYANVTGANTFVLYDTLAHAQAGGATGKKDLTGTGNNAQYFDLTGYTTATVRAALGSGAGGTQVTHAGWVRRTVGTGGRAGRVFYETLVASGSITGDQADDVQFHDV